MTLLLVGGGSGGHITPLLAVAKALKSQSPQVRIVAVSERGGKFASIFDSSSDIDQLTLISAGKLRRYHGESGWSRIKDVRRNLVNLRDMGRLLVGFFQSVWLLIKLRPDAVLIKGGYVGVPVGLAAWLLRIPYITHDSDSQPGLTNRLIARGARTHAVGMPKGLYGYPAHKIVVTGVPVAEEFRDSHLADIHKARQHLGLPEKGLVLLITGGSNGAQRLDQGLHAVAGRLLDAQPTLHILHQVGAGNNDLYSDFNSEQRARITSSSFFQPLASYSAAADLIIARAGATTLAEFAAQRKPVIVVPNPYLTGGHQLKNAEVFEVAGAIRVVSERELQHKPDTFFNHVNDLLKDPTAREQLAQRLHESMPGDAAAKLANLLMATAKGTA